MNPYPTSKKQRAQTLDLQKIIAPQSSVCIHITDLVSKSTPAKERTIVNISTCF